MNKKKKKKKIKFTEKKVPALNLTQGGEAFGGRLIEGIV